MDPIDRLLRLAAEAGLAGLDRGTSYGTPSLKVRGKFLARLKDDSTLVIRCPLDEKAVLMAAEPGFYFETDHYVGYPAVLVRLDAIDDARLKARLEQACAMQAAKKRRYDCKPSHPTALHLRIVAGQVPDVRTNAGNKSLLLLFFRKEDSCF